MGLLSKTPRCNNKLVTVGDVLDKLTAFNALFESGESGSVTACSNTEAEKANWRKEIRENVINCSGRPTELDFFEKIFGSPKPQNIGASELFIKYNCDKDYNIYAATAVTGGAPGAATSFTLLKSMHGGNGKYSNVAENGSLYIYEDRQWVRVTDVDKTTDYAHVVTVVPYTGTYTVNIRGGKKMMFTPVRMVDGYHCAIPSSTWDAPGYISSVKPISYRKDWELPIDLLKAHQEIFQFALIFDKDGNQKDAFVPYEQEKAREEMKLFKNLFAFIGTKMTNTALVGSSGVVLKTGKYSGFDGYLPTMRYGGGTVYDYDPALGFSLDADFMPIILRQDALKRSKAFTIIHGLNFMAGAQRNNAEIFKAAAGQNNLSIYGQKVGMTEMEVVKLGISAYQWLGYSVGFKMMDALTDSRMLGNDDMPDTAMMIPMDGLRDSKGNSVPAIEFFNPQGASEDGSFWESGVIDHRRLENRCNKLSGWMTEDLMMAVHCPQLHVLLNPKRAC
jgi:hypothetical protein